MSEKELPYNEKPEASSTDDFVEKDFETAVEQVHQWLDSKKVSRRKQQQYEAQINIIAREISDGWAYINSSQQIVQKLRFPVTDRETLTYKNRLTKGDVDAYTKNLNPRDGEARVVAYICALTGLATGEVKRLDMEDLDLADAIAVFFIG
jgi:integrase